jgi:hypothetical protein
VHGVATRWERVSSPHSLLRRALLCSAVAFAAGGVLDISPVSAAPVAVTRDLDADGHIDAVDLSSRSAIGVRVRGYRTAGPARRVGRGVRIALRERPAADTAARPRIVLGGRRITVRDGAAPAVVGVRLAAGRPVLVWSEPPRVRRGSARVRLDWRSGRSASGPLVLRHGRRTPIGLIASALPRRVSATRTIAVLRDRAGNRVARFARTVGPPARPAAAPTAAPTPPPAAAATPSATPVTPAPRANGLDTPVVPVFPVLAPQAARSAAAFVDSIGVNVHLSYGSTAYNDFPAVRDALVGLGIHHIRDGACAGCRWLFSRYLALGALGIKATMIIGSPKNITGTLADNLASIRNSLRPAVDAVEGPNEYDAAGDDDWVASLRAYQQDLYQRVRADPALTGLSVIGPSFTSATSRTEFGDQSAWMDSGNMHPYPGGEAPSKNLTGELGSAAAVSGSKPVVATETGYHDATATTSGHRPVSEAAAGVYIPDLFLEYFRRGVQRTFSYELVDERPETALTNIEQHFGLLRNDFSPKPAYTNLRNLIAAVGDSAPAGAAGALRYDVVGGDSTLRRLLLQRADGGFSLVLWRDVRVWDPVARQPIAVVPQSLTVRLGQAVASAGVVQGGATLSTSSAPREVPVTLGADPVVVRLG